MGEKGGRSLEDEVVPRSEEGTCFMGADAFAEGRVRPREAERRMVEGGVVKRRMVKCRSAAGWVKHCRGTRDGSGGGASKVRERGRVKERFTTRRR